MLIKDCPLSVRAIRALSNAGYSNISDLEKLTPRDLLKVKHLGKLTARQIIDYVKTLNPSTESEQSICLERELTSKNGAPNPDYLRKVLVISISELGWSVRTLGILECAEAKKLVDLVIMAEGQLLRFRNCGKKSVSEIKNVLNELDLSLGMEFQKRFIKEIRSEKSKDALEIFLSAYPKKRDLFNVGKARYLPQERIDFYKSCHELYKSEGTLQAVAVIKKLTRERIRQILVKGTKLGLFKYIGHEYPYIPKETILSDYSEHLSLRHIATKNGISASYLNQLLTAYRISDAALRTIKDKTMKEDCIRKYRQIEAQLGRPPTTTDLQKGPNGDRYLSIKISRLWGSIYDFRKDLSIPNPIRVWPEAYKIAFEKRKRLAFIIRMQNLDQIRECLESKGPQSAVEISYECGVKPNKVSRLINLLMANKEVTRIGDGNQVTYKLNRS